MFMEILQQRLFCRSAIPRRNSARNNKRLFRHFAYNRSNRRWATNLILKDRNLNNNCCGLLSSEKSNSLHHNSCFSRYFSDCNRMENGETEDGIDQPPHNALNFDFSSNGDVDNSFGVLMDKLPQMIKQNVRYVLRKENKKVGKKTKSRLEKRWEFIFKNEISRHHRRIRLRSSKSDLERTKLSIENQWDQAFRRSGYCIFPKLDENTINADVTSNALLIDAKHGEVDETEETSPIFGLQMNQRREDNDDYIDQVELGREGMKIVIMDEKKVHSSDVHVKSILECISLLISMTPEDWRKYDSCMYLDGNRNIERQEQNNDPDEESCTAKELDRDDMNLNQMHGNMTRTQLVLQHISENKRVLNTSLVNILLAHLVTSTEIEMDDIAKGCLQIFEEMKMLAESGRRDCEPDSVTYRILILAFTRRFQAISEAVKLSQEMVEGSSIDIGPDLLNEGLRACHAKAELTVARLLMNSVLNSRSKINATSCMIYTEMLKTGNLDQEAIDMYDRIQKADLLTQKDEVDYLTSLCRWPQRSRRGDLLDLSSFWTSILHILEQKTTSSRIPDVDVGVWMTFLEALHNSAKNDGSLWKLVASATRTVFTSYPGRIVGRKLINIGLDASSYTEDPDLTSSILKRLADQQGPPNSPSEATADNNKRIKLPASVPYRSLKNSLEICLKTSDAKSAKSILESMDRIGDPYPLGAKAELYSLVLRCHAKVNDADNAKITLEMMKELSMKPSEELYGEVLRTMAAAGEYQDMEEFFQSMQSEVEIGTSSYDAIIFGRIKQTSWDDIFSLYEEMKAKGINPSSQTIEGLIVANYHRSGREAVLSSLKSLILDDAQFSERTFRLASKYLYKDVDDKFDDFRNGIRKIGESHHDFRSASVDLLRSIRFAEIESGRPRIVHGSEHETKKSEEDAAWKTAVSDLLVFAEKWSAENENGILLNSRAESNLS